MTDGYQTYESQTFYIEVKEKVIYAHLEQNITNEEYYL